MFSRVEAQFYWLTLLSKFNGIFYEVCYGLFYLSIYTASPPLGDYVQVRVSAVLVEEMLLKIKSSHKIC